MTSESLGLLSKAELIALVLWLCKRVGELEVKLGEPPRTPENSSLPPSLGRKASGCGERERLRRLKRQGKARPLHLAPDEERHERAAVCGADVTGLTQQAAESYDRLEIPEIKPHATRIIPRGGVCPCCGERFKAKPRAEACSQARRSGRTSGRSPSICAFSMPSVSTG